MPFGIERELGIYHTRKDVADGLPLFAETFDLHAKSTIQQFPSIRPIVPKGPHFELQV